MCVFIRDTGWALPAGHTDEAEEGQTGRWSQWQDCPAAWTHGLGGEEHPPQFITYRQPESWLKRPLQHIGGWEVTSLQSERSFSLPVYLCCTKFDVLLLWFIQKWSTWVVPHNNNFRTFIRSKWQLAKLKRLLGINYTISKAQSTSSRSSLQFDFWLLFSVLIPPSCK